MKTASKAAALILLLVFTAGCRHKKKPILPLQVQAPPVSAPPATSTSPPQLPTTPGPQVHLAKTPPPPKRPKKSKRKRRRGSKPETQQPNTTTPAPGPPAATAAPPAAGSPIGNLTTSGDTASHENRSQIAALLDSTEKGLNGLKRPLNTEEQTTATETRSFLDKARQALAQGDLDGAHTLGTKAKVLLDELTKP